MYITIRYSKTNEWFKRLWAKAEPIDSEQAKLLENTSGGSQPKFIILYATLEPTKTGDHYCLWYEARSKQFFLDRDNINHGHKPVPKYGDAEASEIFATSKYRAFHIDCEEVEKLITPEVRKDLDCILTLQKVF